MNHCKKFNPSEVKDESVYRAALAYQNASDALKAAVSDRLEKLMMDRLGDCECALADWSIIISEDEFDPNLNDCARAVYKSAEGKWTAEGECAAARFDDLSAETVIALFASVEDTINEIDREDDR